MFQAMLNICFKLQCISNFRLPNRSDRNQVYNEFGYFRTIVLPQYHRLNISYEQWRKYTEAPGKFIRPIYYKPTPISPPSNTYQAHPPPPTPHSVLLISTNIIQTSDYQKQIALYPKELKGCCNNEVSCYRNSIVSFTCVGCILNNEGQ